MSIAAAPRLFIERKKKSLETSLGGLCKLLLFRHGFMHFYVGSLVYSHSVEGCMFSGESNLITSVRVDNSLSLCC